MSDRENHNPLQNLIMIVLFISTLYLMIFVESDVYVTNIHQEIKANYDLMGEVNASKAKERADNAYRIIVQESGFESVLLSLISEQKGESKIVDLTNPSDKYIAKFVNNARTFCYQLIYRMSNLFTWMYILIPFLVFTLIDAYYSWKIKQYSFGKTEQKKYTAWKKFATFKLLGLLCCMLLPSFYGYGIAWLAPSAIFLIAITTNRTIRHYQKMTG